MDCPFLKNGKANKAATSWDNDYDTDSNSSDEEEGTNDVVANYVTFMTSLNDETNSSSTSDEGGDETLNDEDTNEMY